MKKKEMKYIQHGKEIKWLEKDPSPPSKVSRISRTYYRSCQYGELKLAVGDFVLISDLSAGDEDHIDGCEIAEIMHLYDTGDPDESDPCWLTVQWFTRWAELPPPARKALPAGLPPPLSSREVVLDARPFNPEVLISTVWDKCEVRVLDAAEDPAVAAVPGQLPPAVFITRFALQPKPLRLLPISGMEWRPPRGAGSGTPGPGARREAGGRTPTAGGRRGSTGKENDIPTTPSRQSTPEHGLSRSGRRRKERSYRDLIDGKRTPPRRSARLACESSSSTPGPQVSSGAPRLSSGAPRLSSGAPRLSSEAPRLSSEAPRLSSGLRSSRTASLPPTTSWNDDDSVTVSYTSPNKMVLKLSRLSGDKIREMLEDDEELNTKKATPKRKARKSPSPPPANGRATPRSAKKTPRPSRENTPSRTAKRATPRPKTEGPAGVMRETARSRGSTPVSAKAATPRSNTPTPATARSVRRGSAPPAASPAAGRDTAHSARRSLSRRPSLATVAEEQSPGAGSRSSSRPPARRLFAAEAGGAKRRRLSVAPDSDDEREERAATPQRGGRGRGRDRPRSVGARCSEREDSGSSEDEYERTPVKRRGRGRAAASPATSSRGRGRGRGPRSASVPCSEDSGSSEDEYERTPVKRRGRGRAAASPATPSRGRGRGRGRGGRSVAASPRTPKVAGTPLVPGRPAGCLDTPGTPLERARSRLHVAAVPEALPCRENEFFDIYTFVEARLLDGTGGCMYVSGVPGTGKTATMREVVSSLQEAVQTGDLPAFQFVEVNGMRLTEPQRVYCQILSELTGNKAVPEHAAEMLDRRFSQPAGRRQPVLLMVDELDLLWTRKQNVLYNLFDWPSRPHARLIVVAIANTMDLPERIMMNRVSSRLGLTRMTFQPYTFRQLQEIVTSRLRGLDAFDPDAVQLVARKVAAVSGDARRALDICRRATELAERGPATGRRLSSPKKSMACPLVTMEHVNGAIQEMFSSPKIMAIRSCPLQARSLLQAVVAEFQRTGLEEARLGRVYEQMAAVCRFEGVTPPTLSETFALVAQLSAVRLLHTQHARHDLETRLRLNISVDDVSYAVQEMPDL